MSETLVLNEIYLSVQGESTFAGLPCVFIRLTGCNLRCSYCDTAYAFRDGRRFTLEEIVRIVRELAQPFANAPGRKLPLIELTGGEPLLQRSALPLMKWLCDEDFTVLLETSGALDISEVDPRVHRIMDLKCPSSGETEHNRVENLDLLTAQDELKFVIGTAEDYEWSKAQIQSHQLAARCPLLFSWVSPIEPHQQDPSLKSLPPGHNPISRQALVELIIRDALPVRFQLQMHKFIWPSDQRGV